MSPVRLQKFLAEAGVGSRRHCERLMADGNVTVNGVPATTLGTKVEPGRDVVHALGRRVQPERRLYVALNKPAGVVCTNRDTHARQTAVDLLPDSLPRLYSVGRLDKDTEGLLLLTNDGNFSLRLTHPRYKMPKTYLVEVEGVLKSGTIARLLNGVSSEGERLRAEKISHVRPRRPHTELQVVLAEGKKRQIRRMLAAVGHPVTRLVRLAIGSFQLGDLKPGQWRHLSDEEVYKLMVR
jgi:pseudouridine synthase